MIYSSDGRRLYSPRDLIAYLEGDFAAWCERMQIERGRAVGAGSAEPEWVTPDEADPELALVARKGQEHEARYLQQIRTRYPALVELAFDDPMAAELTLAALGAGAPAVYQAHLSLDGWHGYADFLIRTAGRSSLGDYLYVPWDTKLARSAKPYFLIQLCAYADLLEKIQGVRPSEIVFVLGDGTERHFKTDDFYFYYLHLKERFLEFQSEWVLGPHPDPGLDRSWGRWTSWAEQLLAQSDHLSRVAGISRGQVSRLQEEGITCFTALATSTVGHVPRISDPVLQRLQAQARLQAQSMNRSQLCWEPRPQIPDEPRRGLALLPPPSASDVFFDMEGFPFAEEGLEYLWGAVTVDGGSPGFHDWWAHDSTAEQEALEQFVDWVWNRWKQDPAMHIYHYATYEPATIKRLMGRYATREAQVDDLLRNDVFVDLYTVVRQGFIIGTSSYSLKKMEGLYQAPREGDVVSASGSIIQYQKWLDQAESRDWRESPILRSIRDYNEVDCQSTRLLRDWLLERQREADVVYIPDPNEKPQKKKEDGPDPDDELAARLVARGRAVDPTDENGRLDKLIGWLVEFHRREEKPMWWRMFDRHRRGWEDLRDDLDCLAYLTRTDTPQRREKRSWAYEYRFDPEQDTKLREGDECYVAGDHDLNCTIVSMDQEKGLLELKTTKPVPYSLCLIPKEDVPAGAIKKAIGRYAAAREERRVLSQAVDDLLSRRQPRVKGHVGGPLLPSAGGFLSNVCDLVGRLEGTTLCIQGPPGTGKTFTAAAVIADLMRRGKRVGVTATSHKVILNLLGAVVETRTKAGESGGIYKVGKKDDEGEEALIMSGAVALIDSKVVAESLGPGVLVGGTAWVFSRDDLQDQFDYLFIDEAGQVCLANAVAVGLSAKNLILVGDQMQLAQPTQGSHPGETGRSCLEYVLQGRATIPPDLGVFLGVSYRMHSDVCRFISDAVYEGRLTSFPDAERHRVIAGNDSSLVSAEHGIVWFPVDHEGNGQSSEEEVEAIAAMTKELLRRSVVNNKGIKGPMTIKDILFVAPFNAQVRCLTKALGTGARVGSVDRFQGQEAPVVIVSLCASTLEEAPRGAEFLLSPNRLNVAISRAQALAIVVGSSELPRVRCRSVEEMKLVNLLCRVIHYAGQGTLSSPESPGQAPRGQASHPERSEGSPMWPIGLPYPT